MDSTQRKRLREKKKMLQIKNISGSASRRASTERRKTKKTLVLGFYTDCPSTRVDYT
jgi:hypothetical protein